MVAGLPDVEVFSDTDDRGQSVPERGGGFGRDGGVVLVVVGPPFGMADDDEGATQLGQERAADLAGVGTRVVLRQVLGAVGQPQSVTVDQSLHTPEVGERRNDGDRLRLTYGAQDVSQHDSGAYTGEISGSFLAKLGCTFVVVGHSERRTYHHEDDALVAAKAAAAFRHGLTPIVCIGEHLDIREAGNHVEHNVAQLRGSLAGLTNDQLTTVVIAYEPVWAIGTGRVASAADAQEVCGAIRTELAALSSPAIADGVRVLYGGSVNAKNVGEIVAQPDVDGALVGGASLEGEQFAMLSAIAAGGPLP